MWSWAISGRWEADTKKPALRQAGSSFSGPKGRSAEQRSDADAGVDPAFVDHLDRDIEDHREADIGNPAIAFDIFGDDVRRAAHQSDREDQPDSPEEHRVGKAGGCTGRARVSPDLQKAQRKKINN